LAVSKKLPGNGEAFYVGKGKNMVNDDEDE
jgi:hypothetical protein